MTSEVNILEIEANKSLGGEKGQYEEWAAAVSSMILVMTPHLIFRWHVKMNWPNL